MTPTMAGRLETRFALLVTAGVAWTTAVVPVLPRPAWVSTGAAYRTALEGLATIAVLGIAWELGYHALQQLRWDKDWPSLFSLLVVLPEGITAWLAMHALGFIPGTASPGSPFLPMFATHVASTWTVVWLAMQGPVRVLLPRWRYHGGRMRVRSPGADR